MKSHFRLSSLIVSLLFVSWPAVADASDAARVAIEYSETVAANTAWLEGYQWQSTLDVKRDGKTVALAHSRVRMAGGEVVREPVSTGGGDPKAEFEEAMGKPLTKQVVKLIDRYLHASTGTVVDFFTSAEFKPSQGGLMEITGRGFIRRSDRVTLILDYGTRRPQLFRFESEVDGEGVRGSFEFSLAEGRPYYTERAVIEFPKQKVVGTLRNFEFQAIDSKPMVRGGDVGQPGPSGKARDKAGPAAIPEDDGWPKVIRDGKYTMQVYQPQVDAWTSYRKLEATAAVILEEEGVADRHVAAVDLTADTDTNFQKRTVLVSNLAVASCRFPSLEGAAAQQSEQLVRRLLPSHVIPYDLDRLIASVERGQIERRETDVNMNPPKIIVSNKHAILVALGGEAQFTAIEGSPLLQAVNTSADLFLDPQGGNHYLLYEDAWLVSRDLKGPWGPAGALPPAFAALPSQFASVTEQIPGYRLQASELPAVHVATEPTELVVVYGAPNFTPIPGTRLLWVTNTQSDLFLSYEDSQYYFLVAGRWFRTKSLEKGPWSPASLSLPADFARIPPVHEKGGVRASVPGTPEAEDAAILAQIPQAARINRSDAKADVSYVGDPSWVQVSGAPVQYAENTSDDVFFVGGKYYLCSNGVWFVGETANGVWVVADSIPSEIYQIPSTSPKHHVTYVHVYDTSPDYVVVGYTPGYVGVFVTAGLVVAGTCWAYHHHPHYYHHWHHHYHHHHGRFHAYHHHHHYHGYGHGARYDVHRGGFHATSAYYSSFDRAAATRQVRTPYGSWGRSVAVRGDDWVRTGHRSGPRGTVAGFETSRGNRGVAYKGPGGAKGIKTRNNDIFVGRDGHVYRRDNDGWQKHGKGGWSRTTAQSGGATIGRTRGGSTKDAGAARSSGRTTSESGIGSNTRRGLERESRARQSGSSRSKSYRQNRSSSNRSSSARRTSGRSSSRIGARSGGASRSGGARRGGGRRR